MKMELSFYNLEYDKPEHCISILGTPFSCWQLYDCSKIFDTSGQALPIDTTRKSRKWLLFSAYYWQQTKTKHTPTHDLSKAKNQHFILPIKRTEIRHRALAVKTKTPAEIEQRNKEEIHSEILNYDMLAFH